MSIRTLQVIGLVCLLAGIALGAVAAGIEAAQYQPDSDGHSAPAGSEQLQKTSRTVRTLVAIAIPVFLAGGVLCWIAWIGQDSPERSLRLAARIPGGRYSAAKLCLGDRRPKRSQPNSLKDST